MPTKFQLKIDNLRGDENQLHLLLTPKDATNIIGIKPGVSTIFSDFKTSNPSLTIEGEIIDGARLYVGYGDLPAAPVPEGDQYYGPTQFNRQKVLQWGSPATWIAGKTSPAKPNR